MAEDEEVPKEEEASRPSTANTYMDFAEPQEPELKEDFGLDSNSKRSCGSGKHGAVRMPELPSEILET